MRGRGGEDRADGRFSTAGRSDPAAPRVELGFARDGGIRIGVARGASVAACIDTLADKLVGELGTELPPLAPDAGERLEMQRLGAASYVLLVRYRAIVRHFLTLNLPDNTALAASARELVAADPAWPRAYALLAMLEGRTTPEARAVLDAARVSADPARDPRGARLLEVYDRMARGEVGSAYDLLVVMVEPADTDVLVVFHAAQLAIAMQRADEATALARRLHYDHPELAFGADLAELCRRAGRDAI